MIQFKNIVKSFGPKAVLEGVSFDVHPGEVFFIIGASGVGKSVLIKHLVGLLYPDAGEIWLDGEEISKKDEAGMFPVRMKCAMVFQHSTLFAVEPDLAAVGVQQADQVLDEHTLADARRADDEEHLAVADVEADVVEDRCRAEGLLDVLELDHGGARGAV